MSTNEQNVLGYNAGFKDGANAGYKLAKQDLKKKIDDLEKDALRYRWLRDGNNEKNSEAMSIAINHYGDEWDEMIDAAMQDTNHDNQ